MRQLERHEFCANFRINRQYQPCLAAPAGQTIKCKFLSLLKPEDLSIFRQSQVGTTRVRSDHSPLARWRPFDLEVLSEVYTCSRLSPRQAHYPDRLLSRCLVAPSLADGYQSQKCGRWWLACGCQHLRLQLASCLRPEVWETQELICYIN